MVSITTLTLYLILLTPTCAKLGAALSLDYYAFSCPFAELIVRDTVSRAMQGDMSIAAGLLRMHFHDCFVEGCDGSILIDSTSENKAEKDSPANLSLRGYEVIDEAKQMIEDACPDLVSCADIIAMAARDAVLLSGGPMYDVPMGRKDGRRSRMTDTINLPSPTFNASELITAFSQRGLSAQEMVVLSGTKANINACLTVKRYKGWEWCAGGHTLGVARCSSFKNRLTNSNSNSDVDVDVELLATLQSACSEGDDATVAFDESENDFDNSYFMGVEDGRGVLSSDGALMSSRATRGVARMYASNQASFFFDFSQAMLKLGTVAVKDVPNGDVRRNCRQLN